MSRTEWEDQMAMFFLGAIVGAVLMGLVAAFLWPEECSVPPPPGPLSKIRDLEGRMTRLETTLEVTLRLQGDMLVEASE